jgi:DNA replication protein DnaC
MVQADELVRIEEFATADLTEAASEERTCAMCGQSTMVEPMRVRLPDVAVVCPDCAPLSAQLEEEEAAEAAAVADSARRRLDVDRCLRCSDLPTRLAGASFETFGRTRGNAKAHQTAQSWLETRHISNLIIHGPIGSGKSYLAACVFRALLEREEPSLWLRAPMLLAEIKRGFRLEKARDHSDEILRLAVSVPVLFLDDLGKTHPGRDVSWVEEQLYLVIDARYGDMLPTVVTTEWASAALAERVGESVVSRLLDGAVLAGLGTPAQPYRRPKE